MAVSRYSHQFHVLRDLWGGGCEGPVLPRPCVLFFSSAGARTCPWNSGPAPLLWGPWALWGARSPWQRRAAPRSTAQHRTAPLCR